MSNDPRIVCRLVPMQENGVPEFPVKLPDGQPVVLGRSPVTGIKDKRLSRHQVEVTADEDKRTLKCKQLGANPCLVSDEILAKGEVFDLPDGATLHLLLGRFQYRVEFTQRTEAHSEESGAKVIINKEQNSTLAVSANQYDAETKGIDAETKGIDEKHQSEQKETNRGKAQKRTISDVITSVEEKQSAKKSKMEADIAPSSVDSNIDDKLAFLQKQAEKYEKKNTVQKTSAVASTAVGEAAVKNKEPEKLKRGEASTGSEWEEHGSLVVHTSSGVRASNWGMGWRACYSFCYAPETTVELQSNLTLQLAIFDMDGTIITTQSGKVFPTSTSDWRILYPDVPGKIKKLSAAGYKIVFFTNQMGIGRGKVSLSDMKQKVCNIIKKLGIPVQVLMATGHGKYRKPAVGMWTYLQSKANGGINADIATTFYVGDAAGRPVDWKPKVKKDFSCSDRLFALNVGLKFYTPEEYFLGQKRAKFNMPTFDPRNVTTGGPLLDPSTAALPSPKQEVLILVGYPASGKSSFVKNHLLQHKYVHINRDTMGTWQKCVSASTTALNRGQSVVVDNTNPDIESRKRYLDCAKKAGVQCRCFILNATIDQARHNEKFRQMTDAGKDHASIKDMVYYSYRNKYVEPSKKEGFDDVVKVNFVPMFHNDKERKLYSMFLLEK